MGRRKNFGEGYGYTFHGSFTEKADAVAKEAKTPGSFIKGTPTKKGYRWVVMKPRTNPIRRRNGKRKLFVGDKKFSRWETARNYALKQAANFNDRIAVLVREADGTELTHWIDPPAKKNPAPGFSKTAGRQRAKAKKLYLRMTELLAAGKLDRSNKLRLQLARLNTKMGWDMAYVASFSTGGTLEHARPGFAGNRNPAELIVLGANPGDDPWMLKAAAELYPGKSLRELSAERDELSRVLQLAAELKRDAGAAGKKGSNSVVWGQHRRANPIRANVEFGEYEKGIFHPWTRRPRTRRKQAVRRTNINLGFLPAHPTRADLAASRRSFRQGVRAKTKEIRGEHRRLRASARQSFPQKGKLQDLFHEVYGKNPAAADLRETFTGAPVEWVTVSTEPHMPAGDYAQLGELLALYVKPRAGGPVQHIQFKHQRPLVVAAESARQIYFVGGDQDVSGSLEVFGAQEVGDGVFELGELRRIDYKQRKEHVPDPDVDEWRHELGEETGELPVLLFDRSAARFLLEGGAYEIRAEGIVN